MGEVLDKFIEAKGCVVPDEFLRSGRQARRWDDKRTCTRRVTKRQRKTILVAKPYHPELDECWAKILGRLRQPAPKKVPPSGD